MKFGRRDGHDYDRERATMVDLLRNYGVADERVLEAMATVPRHRYVPEDLSSTYSPYGDYPVPIGHSQTISQPYIVAYMTERLRLEKSEKVLEIGTGSGYQAAILAAVGAEVYSVEFIPELAAQAHLNLATDHSLSKETLDRIHLREGNGYDGWPEHAPYDAIIATCAPREIPPKLVEQLRDGGRLIAPVGKNVQRLIILRKKDGIIRQEEDIAVMFVPMVRE